jgi:K+-sensing histidine kinase KdpD
MKPISMQFLMRFFMVVVALIFAFASLYYTNDLVNKLVEREQKLIDLFAKGLQSVAKAEDAENLTFLFQEIIQANSSVPVILTDSEQNPISHKNVDIDSTWNETQVKAYLQVKMLEMKKMYQPIEIEYIPGYKNYIYYQNSTLIQQLKYYPYIQLTVIFLFVMLGYLVFNNSRRAEQNRVWVGMSKETAHQLATPISSLIAWLEIFKHDENFSHPEAVEEIEKDIKRLETITSRFSNIGSVPVLKKENLQETITQSVDYIKVRVSEKVKFELEIANSIQQQNIEINKALFDWALENIIKNAIDAMSGIGKITIQVIEIENARIAIDISDTGKGMSKKQIKKVFEPGFTTKQRGWGLGLTLTKRIIEEYHKGKVFVRTSDMGKGTCFRMILKTV